MPTRLAGIRQPGQRRAGQATNPLTPIALLPSQFIVACVDYDNRVLPGNDVTGYPGISSDLPTALNLARATPFKTYDRLAQLLPGMGNNAFLYVMGKGRVGGATYLTMAGANQTGIWRQGLEGYSRLCTRSALDFTDSSSDKIIGSFVPVAGTSATGYNPTAGATVNTIPCQIAGGGAAGLPAEAANGISTITGYRIRFDAATPTVLLRNACSNVWKNTAAQIIVGANLPATPGLTDVFYIESTELVLGSGSCRFGNTSNTLSISGEKWTAATTLSGGNSSALLVGACECTAAVTYSRMGTVSSFINGFDANGTFYGLGTAGRFASTVAPSDLLSWVFSQGLIVGLCQMIGIVRMSSGIGSGANFGLGILDAAGAGVGSGSISGLQPPQRNIGNVFSGATLQRARVSGAGGSAGVWLNSGGGNVRGIDINNQTQPCIAVGVASGVLERPSWNFDDIVSTDGNNTGATLVLNCQAAEIRWGLTVANTVAAASEISLNGTPAVAATFAGLATSNYVDQAGNNVVGSAGVVMDKPGKHYTNRTAVVAQGQIVRSNATSKECTIARADSAANAAGIIGVAVTAAAVGAGVLVATPGTHAAVLFDAAPTAGAIGYLSTATAGNAQTGAPAVAGTNQKNRLGVVAVVSGNFGLMSLNPDTLATLADGAA